jgi:hypothetical protein
MGIEHPYPVERARRLSGKSRDVFAAIVSPLKCCGSPELRPLISAGRSPQDRAVLELMLLLFRAMALPAAGHQDVVLENLALRHQLRTLQRTVKRPRLRSRERVFGVLLATVWQ